MKLTAEKLNEYRNLEWIQELEGHDLLFEKPDEVILRVANGVGPSWFPPILRTAIDAFHPSMVLASIIHDLEYYYGTGEEEDFDRANYAFEQNCKTIAKHLYGWYNPVRYLAIRKAWQFGKLLDAFGWTAYVCAINERKEDNSELEGEEF